MRATGCAVILACILSGGVEAAAQTGPRHISVWLIPSENAGPNDIAQSENIPAQLDALRASLRPTRLRLLNVEDPLAMKLRSWNPEFNVPNFQWVANQKRTIAALERFADANDVQVVCRFVTWDEAFGLLSANATEGPDAVPDVMQIGTSWAGYFAAHHLIRSRTNWQNDRGNWRDVLGVPASALPYTNDVRLLFYWKRLPSAPPSSPALELNASSWAAILDSLSKGTAIGETAAFPTGVTLNLLHDYASLVWAGPTQRLVSTGLVGPSINLSGNDALTVPEFLASHARIQVRKGEYRRLISFPESSHEEVSRTFVNGGYRVTTEPANFIGRWAEDFEERQNTEAPRGAPRRRFWDYAAAVAPPGGFRGGSELAVSASAQDAGMAFRLADFLDTDSAYTEMLAQAGHLPAGRPGYGIDALTDSLAMTGDDEGAHAFSLEVQKAIDQGHKYPDLENWPTVVENRVVLEKLQLVWRRMAEGDVAGMRRAAEETDWEINSQIYGPSRVKKALLQSWPLFLVAAVLGGGYVLWSYWQRNRSYRQLTILIHLYRASRHESPQFLGDNLRGLVAAEMESDERTKKLSELAVLYSEHLVPHMRKLMDALVDEVQESTGSGSKRLRVPMGEIAHRAREGALMHFQAFMLMKQSQVSFACSNLDDWVLRRYTSAVVVILQEWIFNCLKMLDGRASSVVISARTGALTVVSPGTLSAMDVKALTGPPSRGKLKADAHGLVLIRDILYYAFGTRVGIVQEDGAIQFTLPLPLERAMVAN
jgi:hypothetical protein